MSNPPIFQGSPESRSDWRTGPAYAVFITVFLITMIIAAAVTFILPESYASTAQVKVEAVATNAGPNFIQTEAQVIQSQVVLTNVVQALGLNMEWGKKYFNGEILKTSESMEILKGRLSVAPVRNTEILGITVYSDDRHEAAMIANAVAVSYQNYYLDMPKTGVASPMVAIIDTAVPGSRPVKPNKPLNLALGAALGLFLGAALGWLVALLGQRKR